jgi:RNA polymerase sigma factor (sigma-70 family)
MEDRNAEYRIPDWKEWSEDASGASTDEKLVRLCLQGNETAWSALIDKYRNLIFSIPLKNGFSKEDAAEVLQEVCLALLTALPRLREPRTLAAWLIKVTSHECLHWRRKQSRYTPADFSGSNDPVAPAVSDEMTDELWREQTLRQAISGLAPRCRELIHMLFFTTPSVSYEQVASRLGVAKGSIGFIRMRCLKHLRHRLESSGF